MFSLSLWGCATITKLALKLSRGLWHHATRTPAPWSGLLPGPWLLQIRCAAVV